MLKDDPQLTFLARRWLNGDSALPLVARLRELGHETEAAATARLAIRDPECRDRASSIGEIRRDADEELNEQLDRAGVPRV